jgi:hypothetical protein
MQGLSHYHDARFQVSNVGFGAYGGGEAGRAKQKHRQIRQEHGTKIVGHIHKVNPQLTEWLASALQAASVPLAAMFTN